MGAGCLKKSKKRFGFTVLNISVILRLFSKTLFKSDVKSDVKSAFSTVSSIQRPYMGGAVLSFEKKGYKNTVKPNHFFVILKHSAPIDAGYSVTTFGKLTGKQSKINMNFGNFQRFSAHKLGGGGCALFFV